MVFTIDIILTVSPVLVNATTVTQPGAIADSDHALVQTRVCIPVTTMCSYTQGFGRVSWTSSEKWQAYIAAISPELGALADHAEQLASNHALLDFTAKRKKINIRRRTIDIIAWLRDAWLVMCGHLMGAVRVTQGRAGLTSQGSETVSWNSEWSHMRRSVSKYFSLRQENAGAAERFLSSLLKPLEHLDVNLTGTGHDEDVHGPLCIPAIQSDL